MSVVLRRALGPAVVVGTAGRDLHFSRLDAEASIPHRPLFLRGRIFALLGYEIVEGRLAAGRIGEVRRASMAPG